MTTEFSSPPPILHGSASIEQAAMQISQFIAWLRRQDWVNSTQLATAIAGVSSTVREISKTITHADLTEVGTSQEVEIEELSATAPTIVLLGYLRHTVAFVEPLADILEVTLGVAGTANSLIADVLRADQAPGATAFKSLTTTTVVPAGETLVAGFGCGFLSTLDTFTAGSLEVRLIVWDGV
jgi:hypothetical protein